MESFSVRHQQILSMAPPREGLGKVRRPFDRITDWVIAGLTEAGLEDAEKAEGWLERLREVFVPERAGRLARELSQLI